jgi:hypothetical protein
MNRKHNLLGIILVLALLGAVISGCGKAQPTLTFSQLISEADKYNGRSVTLEAFYFNGFEISALSGSLGPSSYGAGRIVPTNPLIWVAGGITQELQNELYSQSDTPSGYPEHFGKLIVTGKFESGGNYGHMDAYHYRITVNTASREDWTPPAQQPPGVS